MQNAKLLREETKIEIIPASNNDQSPLKKKGVKRIIIKRTIVKTAPSSPSHA
jgi:hypothetical protein